MNPHPFSRALYALFLALCWICPPLNRRVTAAIDEYDAQWREW